MQHIIYDYNSSTLRCAICGKERWLKRYQIRDPFECASFKQQFTSEHAGCLEYKDNPRMAKIAFRARLELIRKPKSKAAQILGRTVAA